MAKHQPCKSNQLISKASVAGALAAAVFAAAPSVRGDLVYYQQTPAGDPGNWYATNWTDTSTNPPTYGVTVPDSTVTTVNVNSGIANTGVLFDPANQNPGNTTFTIGAKFYISSSNAGPGFNNGFNFGGAACVPNYLTIASGTLNLTGSSANSFVLVGRSVNGTINQTGGTFNVDGTVQLGQVSGTNGNGTYVFTGGNLNAGTGSAPGGSPGIRVGSTAIGVAQGSSGTFVVYNTSPGQIKTTGYYAGYDKSPGTMGLTEFHYGNGNVRPIQIITTAGVAAPQLSIRNANDPSTYSANLDLKLDSVPTTSADQVPQSLGLFDNSGTITNGSAENPDAVFWSADRTTRYLDRGSTPHTSYPSLLAGKTDSNVVQAAIGGRTYVWDISYTGNMTLDGNGNVTGVTGHGTGTSVVLIGRSSYVGNLWTNPASDNWSTSGNWSGASPPPNGVDAGANFFNFTTTPVGPLTANVDIPVTLGSLKFDNPNRYTISGANSITMSASSGNAIIQIVDGNHTINTPLVLNSSTRMTVAQNQNLTIGGPVTGNGSIIKAGIGTITLSSTGNNIGGNLTLLDGTAHVTGKATVRNVAQSGGTLSIDGKLSIGLGGGTVGTSVLNTVPTIGATGQLDLGDHAMVINYTGSSPLQQVHDLIALGRGPAGFGNATWNGLGGITSSKASPASQGLGGIGSGVDPAIGYGENSHMPIATFTAFNGQTVNSSSILIKYTRGADATLDGVVDNSDVTVVGTEFNNPNSGQWYLGDFDYSGTCDNSDVTALGTLFNPTAPPLSPAQLSAEFGSAFAQAFAAGQASAAVPEPTGMVLLGLGGLALIGKRRRRA